MSENIVIRKVEINDASQIINLMKKLAIQTKFMLREAHEVNENIEDQENRIKDMLEDLKTLYIVAEVDCQIVGFLISSSRNLERIKHVGDFIIGIDEAFWEKGIGTRLMENLIDWAKEKQLKRLTLEVVESNSSAIKLYKKFGFEVEGLKVGDHYIGNEVYLNTVVMGKLM